MSHCLYNFEHSEPEYGLSNKLLTNLQGFLKNHDAQIKWYQTLLAQRRHQYLAEQEHEAEEAQTAAADDLDDDESHLQPPTTADGAQTPPGSPSAKSTAASSPDCEQGASAQGLRDGTAKLATSPQKEQDPTEIPGQVANPETAAMDIGSEAAGKQGQLGRPKEAGSDDEDESEDDDDVPAPPQLDGRELSGELLNRIRAKMSKTTNGSGLASLMGKDFQLNSVRGGSNQGSSTGLKRKEPADASKENMVKSKIQRTSPEGDHGR